ncbi:50S ribosomal protein L10 [Candidatus Rhabdochlamydia oedothoracis]|uniref:Large ribosomal subunit protein uL10 n=1 Tax=Candidatus Rhabdochlamydia oedothoracis TaxID=2720720 RepID=A0ABX8V298_9BACT|nr:MULTISPECIES: 50S ribosomal protein L10 [Rhabdochlamydia]KAG6559723.1 50S ribosomal protein L10 [Candidatus Rhabdochlamydia sp. W815]MCL6755740.1 50S ribosomal protein L10 [Candidatus Rhabdochlamydia oedothoracis]QYF48622.1 50S ribosomal protein L10 [Candidatus Rhabdochlamydia oedothoracis]
MRQEKQLLLNEIKEKIDGSKALVLAQYQSLEPNVSADLRASLEQTGAELEVVKKRILLKAAKSAGITLNTFDMQGHIAVVFASQDPIPATKVIYKFCQDNEKNVEVVGGCFEGEICSAADVKQISQLPNKEEMQAQLLSVLEAPIAQVLSVVQSLLTSVMYCLDNKSQQENS